MSNNEKINVQLRVSVRTRRLWSITAAANGNTLAEQVRDWVEEGFPSFLSNMREKLELKAPDPDPEGFTEIPGQGEGPGLGP